MSDDKLIIELGGERCKAVLFDDKAPSICAGIRSILPYEGPVLAAKIVDGEAIIPVPFIAGWENAIDPKNDPQELGLLGYWPDKQTVCIFHSGKTLGSICHFGQIVENLEGFQRVAALAWNEQGAPIKFYMDSPQPKIAEEPVPAAIEGLHVKRLQVWAEEPAGVTRLRQGVTKGSYNQSLSPLIYAQCYTQEVVTAMWAMRGLAKDNALPLEALKKATRPFLDVYAGYMSLRDILTDTAAFLREAGSCMEQVSTREEFVKLTEEVIQYSGRTSFWLEELIPWAAMSESYRPTI